MRKTKKYGQNETWRDMNDSFTVRRRPEEPMGKSKHLWDKTEQRIIKLKKMRYTSYF